MELDDEPTKEERLRRIVENREIYLAEQKEERRGYVWTVEEGEFAGEYRDMKHLKEATKDRVKVLVDEWYDEHGCECMVWFPWLKGRHPNLDKLDRFWFPGFSTAGCWCNTDHTGEKGLDL